MKKPNMCTIIGSSGRDFVLTWVLIILFQLYGSRAGLFEGDLFYVGQYDPPTFILEDELIQYQYNLIKFLSNVFKIIPSQKTADIIL